MTTRECAHAHCGCEFDPARMIGVGEDYFCSAVCAVPDHVEGATGCCACHHGSCGGINRPESATAFRSLRARDLNDPRPFTSQNETAEPSPRHPPRPGILATVGNTPLVRLSRLLDRSDVEVFAKLELANPGGSAKDRPAHLMLKRAMDEGRVGPGGLVVESSSGNTAIAMAQFCNLHDLQFRAVVDRRTVSANLGVMRALGAEIEFIEDSAPDSSNLLAARQDRVREIVASTPGAFWPNQHANPANPEAHEHGTMTEIWEALGGRLDYLLVAVSTTGTAIGCRRFLAKRGATTKLVVVDAVGSVIFGAQPGPRPIPGLGASAVPPLLIDGEFESAETVSALDCVVGCRRLARRESILAGGSAGGVVQVLRRYAGRMAPGARCALVLADHGVRYLDTVFDDQWVEQTLDCDPERLRSLVADPDSRVEGKDALAQMSRLGWGGSDLGARGVRE